MGIDETFTPDKLLAGDAKIVTETGTLVSGAGALVRGTVLGKITKGAAVAAADGAGGAGANTGNGTLTMDATTPILSGSKAGIYKVRIKRIALAQVGTTPVVPAQAAIGELLDPDGKVLEVFDIPTTPGVTISNGIKFAILEGATPFALTDGFKVTIAAGSGKLKTLNSANTDGSEVPHSILLEATDATSADAKGPIALSGEFNSAALVFGGSDTYATHQAALRDLNIFGKTVSE